MRWTLVAVALGAAATVLFAVEDRWKGPTILTVAAGRGLHLGDAVALLAAIIAILTVWPRD